MTTPFTVAVISTAVSAMTRMVVTGKVAEVCPAGTTVQAVTKGQQIKVPSETLLEFRLRAPVNVVPSSASRRSRR